MITEFDKNDQEWVRVVRKVDGKGVYMRIPLEQYEREQEAIRVAEKKRAADEEAGKERRAAEAEQQRRAAIMAAIPPLDAMLIVARRGCKEIVPKLRQVLDEHPELVSHYGSLTLQVQENWLQLIAGKDLLLAEAMRRHLDTMRGELAGPNPSPLDKLLVDRIIATHIELLYFTAMEATDPTGENMRAARYRMDRKDQANRHFLAAVKMLATVRNLVARTNVIQIELLHAPIAHSPVSPVVPSANGEQPNRYNGHTNGAKNRFNIEATELANGVNKVNGRNRVSDILTPAGAGVDG